MAKIHIIYDPQGKLSSNNEEMEKQLGLKIAILSIHNGLAGWEIEQTARELARLLLTQVRLDETPNPSR